MGRRLANLQGKDWTRAPGRRIRPRLADGGLTALIQGEASTHLSTGGLKLTHYASRNPVRVSAHQFAPASDEIGFLQLRRQRITAARNRYSPSLPGPGQFAAAFHFDGVVIDDARKCVGVAKGHQFQLSRVVAAHIAALDGPDGAGAVGGERGLGGAGGHEQAGYPSEGQPMMLGSKIHGELTPDPVERGRRPLVTHR